jgi:hypothetical protein
MQDAFLPLKESKSCLIAMELNNYFPLRLWLDFWVAVAGFNRHSIKSAS